MTKQRPIHAKPIVYRRAVAEGDLRLGPRSRSAIRGRSASKGDAKAAGELAGLLGVKRTPDLIPHCHPIPLTGVTVDVETTRTGVRARVEVEALWRTGVEMEALVGVTLALLTVWDMVKESEKDAKGQYPDARIENVRVVEKEKLAPMEGA